MSDLKNHYQAILTELENHFQDEEDKVFVLNKFHQNSPFCFKNSSKQINSSVSLAITQPSLKND